MKKQILGLTLGLALMSLAITVSAQNTLSDAFTGGGFTDPMSAGPFIGGMTLTYSGDPLAVGTPTLLSSIPDYQINISITGGDSVTYTFDNASLAAGSVLTGVEVIAFDAGGFLFSNVNSSSGNNFGGSADFLNGDGSFLTTQPNLSLDELASGYAYYVVGLGANDIMGDYGSGVAPTPEPTTLALAGLSGLGLLASRRRK